MNTTPTDSDRPWPPTWLNVETDPRVPPGMFIVHSFQLPRPVGVPAETPEWRAAYTDALDLAGTHGERFAVTKDRRTGRWVWTTAESRALFAHLEEQLTAALAELPWQDG